MTNKLVEEKRNFSSFHSSRFKKMPVLMGLPTYWSLLLGMTLTIMGCASPGLPQIHAAIEGGVDGAVGSTRNKM